MHSHELVALMANQKRSYMTSRNRNMRSGNKNYVSWGIYVLNNWSELIHLLSNDYCTPMMLLLIGHEKKMGPLQ